MKMRRLLLAGIALFLVGLIVMTPARLAATMLPASVSLDGLQGSVWSGSTRQLIVSGTGIGRLQWQFVPTSVLVGRLGYDLRLDMPGGTLRARALAGPGGALVLEGVEGSFPVNYLVRGMRLGRLDGRVSLVMDRAELQSGWPVSLQGNVAVGNLVQHVPRTTQLGNYQARFDGQTNADGALVGKISTLAAPLDVSGVVSLDGQRKVQLDILISVTASTPDEIRQALPLLAADQGSGRYLFQYSTTL